MKRCRAQLLMNGGASHPWRAILLKYLRMKPPLLLLNQKLPLLPAINAARNSVTSIPTLTPELILQVECHALNITRSPWNLIEPMLISSAVFFVPSPVLPVAYRSQKRVVVIKSNVDHVELTSVGCAGQLWMMGRSRNTFAGGESAVGIPLTIAPIPACP